LRILLTDPVDPLVALLLVGSNPFRLRLNQACCAGEVVPLAQKLSNTDQDGVMDAARVIDPRFVVENGNRVAAGSVILSARYRGHRMSFNIGQPLSRGFKQS
jgi:hypothetical protein